MLITDAGGIPALGKYTLKYLEVMTYHIVNLCSSGKTISSLYHFCKFSTSLKLFQNKRKINERIIVRKVRIHRHDIRIKTETVEEISMAPLTHQLKQN